MLESLTPPTPETASVEDGVDLQQALASFSR